MVVPWNTNDQRGRRASPGRKKTGVLHRIAVRIQWTTSRTTKLQDSKQKEKNNLGYPCPTLVVSSHKPALYISLVSPKGFP